MDVLVVVGDSDDSSSNLCCELIAENALPIRAYSQFYQLIEIRPVSISRVLLIGQLYHDNAEYRYLMDNISMLLLPSQSSYSLLEEVSTPASLPR